MTWITSLWTALVASRGAKIALAILILIVAGLALYVWAMSQHDNALDDAVRQGREQQRGDDLQTTTDRTMEANNAAEAVRTDPAVRDAACLRHARNPEDC